MSLDLFFQYFENLSILISYFEKLSIKTAVNLWGGEKLTLRIVV